ncbi:hypothetical protein CUMW_219920 [Citrus unshiu]|uniref:Uncharacterized protein n=1 Tax=Citrus unshiu TaxID=55188 RepID=A0A2H5QEP2_CITUN|nr:hypothetical protein CUMW_219920 [Citrus unshiu]
MIHILIQKLRQAREAMNEIFPLTPAMWQEFARDEASISTGLRLFWELRRFTKEEFLIIWIDKINLTEKEKQVLRIRTIFHRQLSVPLVNSSATLLAYKSWEVEQGVVLDVASSNLDGISSNVASAYQKAL